MRMRPFYLIGCVGVLIGCGQPIGGDVDPTVTPLPARATIPAVLSHATPAPDPERVRLVAEARQRLDAGEYVLAIALLQRLPLEGADATVRDLLAQSYLELGRSLVARSQGDARLLATAREHFGSGLVSNPADVELRAALVAEDTAVAGLLQAQRDLAGLTEPTAAEERYRRAMQLAARIDQLWEQRPDYPGVRMLATTGQLAVAEVYAAYEAGGRATLEQGAALCAQVLTIDAGQVEAAECQSRLAVQIARYDALHRTLQIKKSTKPSGNLSCIAVYVEGAATDGWYLVGNGLKLATKFDDVGNARLCGLWKRQEFRFTILGPSRVAVKGGDVPALGGESFTGKWVR